MQDALAPTAPVEDPSLAAPAAEVPASPADRAETDRKAENDQRAQDGRRRAEQQRRENAELRRRAEAAEATASAALEKAGAIETYLRSQQQSQVEAQLAQMTDAEQAAYWARQAKDAAQTRPAPAPPPAPPAPTPADLLDDANQFYRFEDAQALRLEELPASAFRSVDAFTAAVNALAQTRAARQPDPEEDSVAKATPKDPDIDKLVAQRVADELQKRGLSAAGASAPNAARPTAPTGTDDPVDYNTTLYSTKTNRQGTAGLRAKLAAQQADVAAQVPRR